MILLFGIFKYIQMVDQVADLFLVSFSPTILPMLGAIVISLLRTRNSVTAFSN